MQKINSGCFLYYVISSKSGRFMVSYQRRQQKRFLNSPPPMNTTNLQLHREQLLLKETQKLSDKLLYI